MRPSIAIVAQNTLMGLGLKTLLSEFLPMAEISIHNSWDEFAGAEPERHVHYFVAPKIYLLHRAFFDERRHKTILLGRSTNQAFPGMHQINIYESEERLVHEILKLRQGAHRPEHRMLSMEQAQTELSQREAEVLTLLAQGLINKEIADRLGIGLTTVIKIGRASCRERV